MPRGSPSAEVATAADHADARALADEAGRLLVALRADGASGGDGDRQSHDLLMRRLAESHPGDAVLSEEGADDSDRVGRERVWIVDPLDGTREFGEPPRTDWAVHVALVVGGEAVVGAVALPAQGRVLSTAAPPPLAAVERPPRMVLSRSRPPAWAAEVGEVLGAELIPMGSAGAKIAAVITGEADVYVHGGGQYEWDSAAPVAVALAVGLHASRIDGSPLRYNRANPWLPDLVVCHPSLAAEVLGAVGERYRPDSE
ncbi:MAG: 3'(2'),5'-bisphosphate nucleotidase CysQ [Acidimicrobiales bacterium]